ncbi:MAG: potassium channel family protein [Candidatus Alkanophagales archaeon]
MKRKSAKELLTEMKDISELMLDLSYSAVIYENKEIACEVLKLEKQMDSLLYNARIMIMLGARSVEDAEKLSGVLQIASAAEKISNAAGDIAKVALARDVPRDLRDELGDLEEGVMSLKVEEDSPLRGRRLGEVEADVGMRVFAMKRGRRWIYSPEEGEVLRAGDTILLVGPTECVLKLHKARGAPAAERAEGERKRPPAVERAIDILVEMKNISELIVGLAYSAVLFYDKEIAKEVQNLERKMDGMKDELEFLVLSAAREVEESRFNELRGLLHIATSSEIISDAAYEIADVVLRGMELHPVFMASVRESDEVISKIEVRNEDISGKTLGELEIEGGTGMFVLAICKKDGRCYYNPAADVTVETGDVIIARGPKEGEEKLRDILIGRGVRAVLAR